MWVRKAKGLKVCLLTKSNVASSTAVTSRIIAPIKYREFRNGTSRAVDTQHLLAPIDRRLKDSNVSGLDHI
jgi:hypothetical protein